MMPGKVKMCILEMRQAELCSSKERKKKKCGRGWIVD
jgi:hypothetical protein